jgi:hypothetical protein
MAYMLDIDSAARAQIRELPPEGTAALAEAPDGGCTSWPSAAAAHRRDRLLHPYSNAVVRLPRVSSQVVSVLWLIWSADLLASAAELASRK